MLLAQFLLVGHNFLLLSYGEIFLLCSMLETASWGLASLRPRFALKSISLRNAPGYKFRTAPPINL